MSDSGSSRRAQLPDLVAPDGNMETNLDDSAADLVLGDLSQLNLAPPQHGATVEADAPSSAVEGARSLDARCGSSTQAHRTIVHDGAPASPQSVQLDDDFADIDANDPTVISRRPALADPSLHRGASPGDLGRQLVGETLDHFELLAFVGGGGMGAVFRARDTMLNREVALKVLSRDQGSDEETRRRFQNEAQSAARLDHENIARVYYVGEDKSLNYIVFEFIEGENLRDRVERLGPLPLGEALSYALQIAEALDHASSRDVVHRDIKPSNVIVTAAGRAKLVDMGLARLHQVDGANGDLTASGVTLGTFDYISPEQAYDPRRVDVRSDIYSLGCTLYYSLVGRPPFPDGTVLQKLLQHKSDPPPDPRDINPTLPEDLVALVVRMLAKEPEKRPQTPRDLIAELVRLLERHGGLLSPARSQTVLSPRAVSRFERHLPWIAPVAVLLAVVAALEYTGALAHGPDLEAKLASRPSRSESNRQADAANAKTTQRADAPATKSRANASPTAKNVDNDASPSQEGAAKGESFPVRPITDVPSDDSASLRNSSEPLNPFDRGIPESDSPAEESSDQQDDEENVAGPSFPVESYPPDSDPAPRDEQSKAPGAKARPAFPAPQPGVLIVVGSEGEYEKGVYADLRTACENAKDGDAIELCFNGARTQSPVAISNINLTIRAGKGFSPVLAFRPDYVDPALYPRAMFAVSGGRLTLHNLAVELNVPRVHSTDSWSLIDARLAREVSLERCLLTVRNATEQFASFQPGVAFMSVRGAPVADGMMKDAMGASWQPVEIRLVDCVARGEAAFLRVNDLYPVNVTWQNGFFASSESLLHVAGGQREAPAGAEVRLELRRITAAVRKGLCRTDGNELPYAVNARVSCHESIIVGGPDAVLVEQLGIGSTGAQQQRLQWVGDRNFYQGFATFWRIEDRARRSVIGLSFEDWRRHWTERFESKPTWGGVTWHKSPPADRPAHALTPNDFILNDRDEQNRAKGAASDGRDAGCDASKLPAAPVEPRGGR